MRRICDAMEEYLATLGLWRKPIAKDGSCLFRAVSEQLFHTQLYHMKLREDCVHYLNTHQQQFQHFVEGPFDQHVNNLRNPWEWAGQVEIAAMSLMYKCDFIIYQHVGKPPENITKNQFKKKVMLAFSDGKQYDSVYPNSYIESSAICQSILYELLYSHVFGLEQAVVQAENMVTHKPHKYRQDSLSEMADSPTPDAAADTADTAALTHSTTAGKDEKRENGHKGAPFPYKVARALSPNCYRNVEYDLWLDSKKEQGDTEEPQFVPGDKCQVTLTEHPNKTFNAHIQELAPSHGPVTVFVEELGEKHQVPLSSLTALLQTHKNHASRDWMLTASKNYRQLSGYYQKAPLSDLEPQGANRKRRGRRKEVSVLVPMKHEVGMPPRPSRHIPEGFDRGTHPSRSACSHGCVQFRLPYGGRQAINAAGHPLKGAALEDSLRFLSLRDRCGFYKTNVNHVWSYPPHTRFDRRLCRGQQHHYGSSHRSQAESSVNGDGTSRSKSVEDCVTFENVPQLDELPPGGSEGQQEFPAPPKGQMYGGSQGPYRQQWGHRSNGNYLQEPGSGAGELEDPAGVDMSGLRLAERECGAAHPSTQPIPIPQPTPNQPYPPDSAPCTSRCDQAPLSGPYYPSHTSSQNLIQPVNGIAAQPNLVMPPGGVPYYPYLIVPHADNMAGPINLSVAPSSDPGGCDLPQNDLASLRFFYNLGVEYYRMLPKIPSPPQPPYNNYVNGQVMYGAPPMMVPPPPEVFAVSASVTEDESAGQYEAIDKYGSECKNTRRQVVYVDVSDTGKCMCGGHDSGCISDVSSCGNGENADSCLSDDAPERVPGAHPGEGIGDSHSDSSSQHSVSSLCGNGRNNNVLAVPSGSSQAVDRTQRAPLYAAKHKSWMGAPPKQVQPLKEIPPRFKKLLAAHAQAVHKTSAFKRSQYMGAPLVKKSHMEGGGRRGVDGSGQYSFNPEAETFIPGQKYECNGQGVAPSCGQCVQQAYVTDADGATPVEPPHPTYTIHIPGGFPAYTCCTADNIAPSDASGLVQSTASRSPATACSPGAIYYANQVYSAQSYMSYVPPAPPNPSVVYNVSQQPQQAAPQYMAAPFMTGCAPPPVHY